MNFNREPALGRPRAASLQGLMASMVRYGVVFDKEGGGGGGDDEAAKAAAAAAAAAAKAKAGDDAAAVRAAELQAEVEKLQSRLKGYEGATPEEIKELRELKTRSEAERKAAEEAKKKAEEEALKAAGNFDELRRRMAEEHDKQLREWQEKYGQIEKQVVELNQNLVNLNVNSSFAASRFITEQTVLTPQKALKVYGDHFEMEDGKVVGYDAPRGAAKRVKLIDGRGQALPFDEAMRRIVEADEDKDRILKATIKSGPGIRDSGVRRPAEQRDSGNSIEKIRTGLANLLKK